MNDNINTDIKAKINEQLTSKDVVLYMKGDPKFPLCGFSAKAIKILQNCGVTDYLTINVLADPEIRQGIKEFSNWPTVPQLYIRGEFIGGSDIMAEMYESGELQQKLKNY